MRTSHRSFFAVVLLASIFGALANAQSQVSVLTWHNDNWRSGQNTNETVLTTSNVNTTKFGLLCKISLPSTQQQEQIYAQPLVVPNSDGSMNVYVATMQDNIYAIKVPAVTNWTSQTCATLQSTTPVGLLKGSLAGQYPADACFVGLGWNQQTCAPRAACPSVGIMGTPVIDSNANIMYLVTESQDTNTQPEGQNCTGKPQPNNWYHYVHALDLSPSNFLNETAGGPVLIAPAQSGGGAIFRSRSLLQRPGLLHLDGPTPTYPTVYMGFSMMDGTRPNPSGWVLAFDGGNLSLATSQLAFATTPGNPNPNGWRGGGVWAGGAGLAAGLDANRTNSIFLSTADGQYDGSVSGNYGDSFLKLSTELNLSDSFTPADWDYRWNQTCNGGTGNDLDLGSAGTMLVPDGFLAVPYGHIAIKGDKEGYIWALDRTTLGGAGTGCSANCMPCTGTNPAGVLQQLPITGLQAKSTPAFWFDGTNPFLYVAQQDTQLFQYKLTCAPICTTPVSQTAVLDNGVSRYGLGYGATPSVSSNGTTNGSAIVWAIRSETPKPLLDGLYAFDATNLATTLYSSPSCPTRDAVGTPTRFSVPTVANGYVFIGTLTDFDIFGPTTASCN